MLFVISADLSSPASLPSFPSHLCECQPCIALPFPFADFAPLSEISADALSEIAFGARYVCSVQSFHIFPLFFCCCWNTALLSWDIAFAFLLHLHLTCLSCIVFYSFYSLNTPDGGHRLQEQLVESLMEATGRVEHTDLKPAGKACHRHLVGEIGYLRHGRGREWYVMYRYVAFHFDCTKPRSLH